jgi:hypothetical protein
MGFQVQPFLVGMGRFGFGTFVSGILAAQDNRYYGDCYSYER